MGNATLGLIPLSQLVNGHTYATNLGFASMLWLFPCCFTAVAFPFREIFHPHIGISNVAYRFRKVASDLLALFDPPDQRMESSQLGDGLPHLRVFFPLALPLIFSMSLYIKTSVSNT